MKRRDFFKWAGLATGGLLASPGLLAATGPKEGYAEALDFALAHALENGALYADARIGPCEIQGHEHPIFQTDLAGFRISTVDGWRFALLRDLRRPALISGIDRMLQSEITGQPSEDWYSAIFDREKILTRRSTDPEIDAALCSGASRYALRQGIPASRDDVLFLEILLEH